KAEAALSAANEKLKGDQVPVGTVGDEMRGYANRCFVVYSDADLEEGDELFTAPQTPIVLPDYRCSPDMHTKQYYETIGFNLGLDACKAVIKAAGFTVKEDATPVVIVPAPAGVIMRPQFEKPLERCAAARDGECSHKDCPQLRDNEPMATGRHCPIDDWDD
ncbi:hypothetical protein, partial [Yersinia enterocolitica]